MDFDDEPESHTPPCLISCLQTFGNMIFPGDRDFDQVCRILSAHSTETSFSSLYCCDLNCGVKFGAGAGHDPNVNNVISRCKGFVISNIIDPGPPPGSKCSPIAASTSLPTLPRSSSPISTSAQAATQIPISTISSSLPIYTSTSSQQTTFVTSSALNIIPSTTSARPPPTTPPSIMAPETQPARSHTFWQKLSYNAKIGSIFGLTIVILLLLILSILFFIRHKRRTRLHPSHSASLDPDSHPLPQSPSPSPISSQNSTPMREITERSEVGRGGGMGVRGRCRNAYTEIVVIETEGKNSVDSTGMRWPDEVVLTGEAKEMREWSAGYGLGDRNWEKGRRARGDERKRAREREKREEFEMGLEKV